VSATTLSGKGYTFSDDSARNWHNTREELAERAGFNGHPDLIPAMNLLMQ
jgi:hypothetical protein